MDASKSDSTIVEKVEQSKLPEAMQKMTPEQRKKHVADVAAKRKKIQDEIKKVAKEREAYIAAELKKKGEKTDTFGDAICAAIDKQMQAQGFGKAKR